jgi:hypothetical protein
MDQSGNILEIITNNTIDSAVFKANRFLISSYKETLYNLSDEDKKEFLKKMWKETFRADVLSDSNDNTWTHVKFFSEKDIILFWMKWKN